MNLLSPVIEELLSNFSVSTSSTAHGFDTEKDLVDNITSSFVKQCENPVIGLSLKFLQIP